MTSPHCARPRPLCLPRPAAPRLPRALGEKGSVKPAETPQKNTPNPPKIHPKSTPRAPANIRSDKPGETPENPPKIHPKPTQNLPQGCWGRPGVINLERAQKSTPNSPKIPPRAAPRVGLGRIFGVQGIFSGCRIKGVFFVTRNILANRRFYFGVETLLWKSRNSFCNYTKK